MSDELLINVTPRETRVALVENGLLHELFSERESKRGWVGNVYKGKVCRVLPGMQAAFVDIGLDKAAFLHSNDAMRLHDEEPGSRRSADITEVLHEGQDVLVQVVKDPLGSKGARLTMHISIPSRYLVFMPTASTIGVSQKIEPEEERQRLRMLLHDYADQRAETKRPSCGFIARTAAEGIAAERLYDDLRFLCRLWEVINERARDAPAPSVIHEDLPLVLRALRDLADGNTEKVRIDSAVMYQQTVEFAEQFVPELLPRLEHYLGERPIFELYGIEDEIHKALDRKVPLKSGGHLVIDQTEAMTTVDVNTGAFVGRTTLEETIFKTNLEAAQAIARQLRLRNLGGIIIIDFIDMLEDDHKRQVLRTLGRYLEKDHAKTYISEVSTLGLVQMTRKRTRESLAHILCEPCPICSGRGMVKTPETICYEVFREILRAARQYEPQGLLILAASQVIDLLMDEESSSLAELGAFIGKPITFQIETSYSQEQYDVVPL